MTSHREHSTRTPRRCCVGPENKLRVQLNADIAAIEVIGLHRHFKGGLKAVDGIDLAVAAGEV